MRIRIHACIMLKVKFRISPFFSSKFLYFLSKKENSKVTLAIFGRYHFFKFFSLLLYLSGYRTVKSYTPKTAFHGSRSTGRKMFFQTYVILMLEEIADLSRLISLLLSLLLLSPLLLLGSRARRAVRAAARFRTHPPPPLLYYH
jgi:hypothetical protein